MPSNKCAACSPERYLCGTLDRPDAYVAPISIGNRLKEVAALFKLRLTSLVVVSAALGYLMGIAPGAFSWVDLLLLCAAGLMVTGASNALNQVIEVNEDALMDRTASRPLVKGSLRRNEALWLAFGAGAVGTLILWVRFGPLAGTLGFLALFTYAALYTPLKKSTPWAVFVGAFPGAVPPMLGYVAATGQFGLGPGLLFAGQFMWQFPHFWAIAWVIDEDYRKAGFFMLPSRGGRDRSSAFLILLYTLFVIPVGMLPWVFELTGTTSMVVAVAAGGLMLYPAYRLFITRDIRWARKLMFASFIYLPAVQLTYVLDRL